MQVRASPDGPRVAPQTNTALSLHLCRQRAPLVGLLDTVRIAIPLTVLPQHVLRDGQLHTASSELDMRGLDVDS